MPATNQIPAAVVAPTATASAAANPRPRRTGMIEPVPTDRLRIIHAVRSDGFAGVERYVSGLANGLVERGHSVTVIGGDPDRMKAVWNGSEVEYWPAVRVTDVMRQLARFRRPHVIHAHMTAAELASVLTQPIVRAPIIVTRHFARPRGSSYPSRAAGQLVGRAISGQISISQYVAEHIDGPSTVVHLGSPTPERYRPQEQRSRAVLVAQRFEPEKRTDLALRIWAASGLADRGWAIRFAGDGALRSDLERLADELGIRSSCEFLGFRSDLPELLASSAILLATCPIEGFGLSVVEAMACGTPVIAVLGGAHAETVGAADEPRLFDLDDVGEGARLLSELAADLTAREAYGQCLRRVQREKFSIGRMVDNTIDAYREFIG